MDAKIILASALDEEINEVIACLENPCQAQGDGGVSRSLSVGVLALSTRSLGDDRLGKNGHDARQ